MKKMIVLLSATILVSSIATIVTANTNGPAEIKFTPRMGTVTFNHIKHQSVTECSTCHHTESFEQCKSCHGVNENAPKSKDAFHKQCKNCHKEMKQGPTKCKQCHIK